MTSTYDPETQIRNMGLFRSGQGFDYDDLEYIAAREIVAEFITYEMVNRAVGKGFTLKIDEEEHPQNETIQDLLKPIYDDFVTGAGKERLFGSLIYEIQQEKEDLFLNTFDPRDFTVEFDEFDKITKLSVTEKIKFFDSERSLETRDVEKKNFDDFLYRYRRGKRNRNEGLSYLESCYDSLVGIQNLTESCVYFVIRVGAGLKVIWVPKDKLNDEEYMSELETNIEQMNASNTTMILGTDLGEEKTEVQLLTSQAIDFNTLLDFYLTFISIKTGIPLTVLRGVIQGELVGAKVNETLLFDILQDIQNYYEDLLRWIIDQVAKLESLELGEYDIEWITREAIDEVGKQDLLTKQLDNLDKLLNVIMVKFDIAASTVGLDLKETDLNTELIDEKKEAMNNLMKQSDDEDTDDTEPLADEEDNTQEEDDDEE